MKIIKRNISELSQDPANARKHNERNLESIVASLRRFGQQTPIVIDSSSVVRKGNGTLEAAKRLGWDTINCVVTDLKSSDAISYAIADNRTAELAEWDDEVLAAQLNGLLADDPELMEVAGFTEEELAALLADSEIEPEVIEDEVPEPPPDPITKPGDLWILGEHRLLCGDSTKAEDVGRLMAGAKAGMMVTDPPYGVSYDGGQANSKKREKLSGDDTTEVFNAGLSAALNAVPSGAWYIWHAGRYAEPVYAAIRNCGFDVRALIVWNKLKAHYGAPSAHYCQKHEPCLYAVKDSAGFCGPSNEVTVWDIEQPHRNEHHPTQKPIICMARAIKNHEAESVYDPFLGSGTTLIAAEQLGRKCYGMEISSQYVDVICNRWAKLTNESPVLEETGETFDQVAKRRRGNE
jgi:DNA modification methylase